MAIQNKEVEQHAAATVVGESILISGKLEGDEDLTVRGRVQGSVTLTRTLIVEPSGVVKADSTVRNAVVSGVVVGNITASESVHLTREGRMVGDINAPRVIIVEGAAFRGRIDMGQVAEPQLQERTSRPAPPPVRTLGAAAPVRTSMSVPRPPPPPPPKPQVRSAVRPPELVAKPPPPPPPPPPLSPTRQTTASEEALAAAAPLPVSLAKRKVVVKRKK
jgi:cytoskeletal protein CcmA (bactofilin family)